MFVKEKDMDGVFSFFLKTIRYNLSVCLLLQAICKFGSNVGGLKYNVE